MRRDDRALRSPPGVDQNTMILAMVAKPISSKDWNNYEGCHKAIDDEWAGLLRKDRPVFDMTCVREWRDVARAANEKGIVIHMARVFFASWYKTHSENSRMRT